MGLQILQKICSFKGQKKGKTSSPTEVFKNLFKCDWKRPEHLKAGLFFVVIYKKQVKETIRKQKENNERTAGFFFFSPEKEHPLRSNNNDDIEWQQEQPFASCCFPSGPIN